MRYLSSLRLTCLMACAVIVPLIACSKPAEYMPTEMPSPAVGTSPLTSPLETPEQLDRLVSVPTPSPNKGVITGVLFSQPFQKPLPETELYLAPLIRSADGKMEVARFDIATAPKTRTDSVGRFVFVDIDPGRYAIILGGVLDQYLAQDARNGRELVLDLDEDQILDMDEIWVVPPEG